MYAILVPLIRYALQAGAGYIAASGWIPGPLADQIGGLITDELASKLLGSIMFATTTAWFYIERWRGRRSAKKEIADAIDEVLAARSGADADERLSRNGQLRD